jgi:hypothetical protein
MPRATEHDDIDGSDQGDWIRSGLNADSPRPGTRRGFRRLLIPGGLIAGGVIAVTMTGGLGLYLSQDGRPSGGGDTIIIEADPVPEGKGEVDTEGLDDGLPGTSGDDEVTALVDGCLNGDPSACDTLLHVLAEECYTGYLISCDALYQVSAYGSAYEDYGATCGGRFYDWMYAGICSSAA